MTSSDVNSGPSMTSDTLKLLLNEEKLPDQAEIFTEGRV